MSEVENPSCVYGRTTYPCHDFYYGPRCRRCGHTPTLRDQMVRALGEAVDRGSLPKAVAINRLLQWQDAHMEVGGLTREGAADMIRFRKTSGEDPRSMKDGAALNIIERRSQVLGIDWEGQCLSRSDIAAALSDAEPYMGAIILRTTLDNLVRDGYLEVRYTRTEKEYPSDNGEAS